MAWGDCDNDGGLDLYMTQICGDMSYAYSYLYRYNNGDGTFTDVANEADVRLSGTCGCTWADYDRDDAWTWWWAGRTHLMTSIGRRPSSRGICSMFLPMFLPELCTNQKKFDTFEEPMVSNF